MKYEKFDSIPFSKVATIYYKEFRSSK